MRAEQLLQHFERISEAPDALPRLRRFILNLAVRGRLVEQEPSDEPATELLKRIGAEKARLVKAGEIRKPKPLPPINKEDLPVAEEIAGWTWIRLGEVSTLVTKGSTPTSYGHAYTNEGINFIKVESIKKGLLRPENITSFISDETNQFLSRSRLAHGDILFSIAGSIGTCAVVTEIILPANTNQACAIIRGTQSAFVSEFLLNSLQSSVASSVLEKARGGAMNNVSLEDIKNFVVPLPPLAEQHRIVAKVDELMSLCDQLDAAKAEREKCRDSLVAASLQGLNQPAEEEETFREHARFTFNNLPQITTRAAHIKQLRQTILNLAVRGKLVEQDPRDESAAEWYRRASKRVLSAECALGVPQFQLPFGWLWLRVASVFDVAGGIQKTPHRTPLNNAFPYLGVSNVYRGRLDLSKVKEFELEPGELQRRKLEAGDLLIIEGNGSFSEIGRCAKWNGEINDCVHQNHVIRCRPFDTAISNFTILFLNSPNGMEIMQRLAITSSGLYSLSVGKIRQIEIPIPPLAEQQRIVAKVDELMAICDQLEAQITVTEQDSRRFLESVLADALAPGIECNHH